MNTLTAGGLADRSVRRVLLGFVIGMILASAGFALFAHTVSGLMLFTALIFDAGTATATQVRMIDIAKDSQALGALNQSALSLGNSVGSFLGGAAIASGLGYQAPAVAVRPSHLLD